MIIARAFAGQNKWVFIRLFWLEGTVIFSMVSLFFLPILFNVIFLPSWIPCGAIINISLPIYLKNKHQKAANGKDFHDCIIRWGRFDWGEFLLGFTNIVEITPDWSDTGLRSFQSSRDFTHYLQRYLTRILIEDFHAKRMGVKDVKKFIKQFGRGDVSQELLEKVDNGVKELKKQKDQKKADIKKAKKQLSKYDLKDLPFSYLNFEDIGINKEYLQKCHLYIGLLYEEECRIGHTIPFDRVAIITEQPKEIVLALEPLEGVDKDDYDIDIKGVKCYYLCVRWLLDVIPLLYLHWSSNMTNMLIDKLKGPDISYLNIKVLEEIVFHKSDDSQQAGLKIQRLETQKQGLEEELSDTVQNFWADGSWGFGDRMGDRRRVLESKMKTKQWKTYAGVILCITTFIIIFFIFFNTNLGTMPIPSPGG